MPNAETQRLIRAIERDHLKSLTPFAGIIIANVPISVDKLTMLQLKAINNLPGAKGYIVSGGYLEILKDKYFDVGFTEDGDRIDRQGVGGPKKKK